MFRLHDAIKGGQRINELLEIITADPTMVSTRDGDGNLPLHLGSKFGSSLDILELLLRYHPTGTSKRNGDGWLPLHLAATQGSSAEIIELLKRNLPVATSLSEAINYWQIDNVRLFLKTSGAEVHALHQAAAHHGSPELIRALIDADHTAASIADDVGRLPLHWAAHGALSAEGIAALLEVDKDAASKRCLGGCLPLHNAAGSGSSPEVISLLVKAYPSGVLTVDKSEMRPLQYAIRNSSSTDIITALVLADMPITEEGVLCDNHGYSFCFILDLKESDLSVSKCQVVVRNIMMLYSANAQLLAHTTDERGREALSIAHAKVRATINEFLYLCGKYELIVGPPVHCSATSIVQLAIQHVDEGSRDHLGMSIKSDNGVKSSDGQRKVALKFMRNRTQFVKEIEARDSMNLDERFVLSKLDEMDATIHPDYSNYMTRIGLVDYPLCMVMPAADRSLKAIIDRYYKTISTLLSFDALTFH